MLRWISNTIWKRDMVFEENEKAILRKMEKAIAKTMAKNIRKVVDKKTTHEQIKC